MTMLADNVELDPLRSVIQDLAVIPFKFTSNGSVFSTASFDYPGVSWADNGVGGVTLTFDSELPDETIAVLSAIGSPTASVVSGQTLTLTWGVGVPANGEEVEAFVFVPGGDPQYTGEAEGVAIGDMERFCAYNPTDMVTGNRFATVSGRFFIIGGVLFEANDERGHYVEELPSGVYRIHFGSYDEAKACIIVNSSTGAPDVTYDGDGGFVTVDFGGVPGDTGVDFSCMANV